MTRVEAAKEFLRVEKQIAKVREILAQLQVRRAELMALLGREE